MSNPVPSWLLIAGTIGFTVYGQLVLKWQMSQAGEMPAGIADSVGFLLRQLLNPWVVSGFVAALVAAFFWLAALSRYDLSFAYPFMALSFVLVLALSGLLLGEAITGPKVVAVLFVVTGLVVGSTA